MIPPQIRPKRVIARRVENAPPPGGWIPRGLTAPIISRPCGRLGSLSERDRAMSARACAPRESLDLAIEDIAQATRVRAAHVAALEAFDLDKLPARPFAIGYVRAYALALGLDADAVVARFRAEAPDLDTGLRAPRGRAVPGIAPIRLAGRRGRRPW